jgi:hypothetical protein
MKRGDVDFARELIKKCEEDLGYKLSRGNKGDLLADNTEWPLDYIQHVLADIEFE